MNKTPLYALHQKLGAKFGPFAGYEMPLFYKTGIIKEHLHTRKSAGLFDISHMMLVQISGQFAAQAISALCPLHAEEIEIGQARYTFFLNQNGGIIDDLIVSRLANDRFLLVCNAGCAQKDWSHIVKHTTEHKVDVTVIPFGLIALQGPKAQAVLEKAGLPVSTMNFMQINELDGERQGWLVSRSGYTGEDGFEIAAPKNEIAGLAEKLLSDERVLPVGLGARDSLRLEAGLSLYGQDLSDEISPMEAGLVWAIPKDLRTGGNYLGAEAIARKIAEGRKRKRVGIKPEGRAPVRAGAEIFDGTGSKVGEVTSGGFGPSVDHPVALGLINVDADSNSLVAHVRSKQIPLQAARLPFTPHKYKR
ncbi:MAG: glycine cleavage system aminomethyltransferase GcvT [Rhizobiaceae bacterium]|nr:glycine cleavage system aminomethyltransferase GcvT [Rhizobiaceae bacterium]